MRTKPVRRDEIRLSDSGRILAFPLDAFAPGGHSRDEPIKRLWAPLIRKLNKEAAERHAMRAEWVKQTWGRRIKPLEPITAPNLIWRTDKCTCKRCGVVFYRDGGRTDWCSDKCHAAARSEANAKQKSEERACAREYKHCSTCKAPIDAQRSTRRFCSVKCRVAAHRAARR